MINESVLEQLPELPQTKRIIQQGNKEFFPYQALQKIIF